MATDDSTESLRREVADLTETLEALKRELEPGDRRRLRPPTLAELRRFTTDVTIPAVILVLETNVRVLRLLQRALQLPDEGRGRQSSGGSAVGKRAVDVSVSAIERLDEALSELQTGVGPGSRDEEITDLLTEARRLQTNVEERLEGRTSSGGDSITIDVEGELESIKDDLADEDDTGE